MSLVSEDGGLGVSASFVSSTAPVLKSMTMACVATVSTGPTGVSAGLETAAVEVPGPPSSLPEAVAALAVAFLRFAQAGKAAKLETAAPERSKKRRVFMRRF